MLVSYGDDHRSVSIRTPCATTNKKLIRSYDKLVDIGTRYVQDIKIDSSGAGNTAVKEGVTVTAVNFSGNDGFSTPLLEKGMKTQPGTAFSGDVFNQDLNSIGHPQECRPLRGGGWRPEVDHRRLST